MTTDKWSIRQSGGQWTANRESIPGPNRWAIFIGDRLAGPHDEVPAELLEIHKKLGDTPTAGIDLGIAVAEAGLAQDKVTSLGDEWFEPDTRGRWRLLIGVRDGSIAQELSPEIGRKWAGAVAQVLDDMYGTVPPKPKPVEKPMPRKMTSAEKRAAARAEVEKFLALGFGAGMPLGREEVAERWAKLTVNAIDKYLALAAKWNRPAGSMA